MAHTCRLYCHRSLTGVVRYGRSIPGPSGSRRRRGRAGRRATAESVRVVGARVTRVLDSLTLSGRRERLLRCPRARTRERTRLLPQRSSVAPARTRGARRSERECEEVSGDGQFGRVGVRVGLGSFALPRLGSPAPAELLGSVGEHVVVEHGRHPRGAVYRAGGHRMTPVLDTLTLAARGLELEACLTYRSRQRRSLEPRREGGEAVRAKERMLFWRRSGRRG